MTKDLGVPASPSGLRPFGAEPAAQSQAEPLVPNAVERAEELPIGHIQWACSEEDGGPDVGVLLRVSENAYLWCGEITREEAERFGANEGRWHIVLQRQGRKLILAQVVDEYCAREAMDELAAALRARDALRNLKCALRPFADAWGEAKAAADIAPMIDTARRGVTCEDFRRAASAMSAGTAETNEDSAQGEARQRDGNEDSRLDAKRESPGAR